MFEAMNCSDEPRQTARTARVAVLNVKTTVKTVRWQLAVSVCVRLNSGSKSGSLYLELWRVQSSLKRDGETSISSWKSVQWTPNSTTSALMRWKWTASSRLTARSVSMVKRMRVASSVGSTGPGRTMLKGMGVSPKESSCEAASAPASACEEGEGDAKGFSGGTYVSGREKAGGVGPASLSSVSVRLNSSNV